MVGTKIKEKVPPGQRYFEPKDVENPGILLVLEHTVPLIRTAATRETFHLWLHFKKFMKGEKEMTKDALTRLQKIGLDDSTAEQLLSFKDNGNLLYDSAFKITDLSEDRFVEAVKDTFLESTARISTKKL
ncbi:uncharacterized protein TNCT_499591 [Trichonephila clavata]|uniref:Uncharacterized protein n=1 Tax=Trichonephila clavata TaxID=2740835 RepID=A0A8X6LFZ4_TRICU|nr:uncharacterized protein TNCT_499591 [Trichonephila clavata]